MITNFLVGKVIDSLIIWLITLLTCLILNLPYAMLVSAIVGITNIIPIVGPFIGAIPGAIIILLTDPIKGLIFIGAIIVIQQLDGNVIGPKCLAGASNISTFWVLFSIVIGGSVGGLIGIVLGIPIFATIKYILNDILTHIENKKNTTQSIEAQSKPIE